MQAFKYETLEIPTDYACARCRAHGIKLWRQYNTSTTSLTLLCCTCADPTFRLKTSKTDQVNDTKGSTGSLVPAVPTEDGDSFWGYTSVPAAGCAWWRSLPTKQGEVTTPFHVTDEEKAAEAMIAASKQRSLDDRARYRAKTVFVVEATGFEQHLIWKEYCGARFMGKEQLPPFEPSALPRTKVPWDQIMSGELATVGEVYKRPICVSVSWAQVHGHIVMFYHPTSRMVDWDKIKAWLADEYKHVEPRNHCDAQNFHNCLHYLRNLRDSAAPAC